MKGAVSLQRLRVKVRLHVLHSATVHVSDIDVLAVSSAGQKPLKWQRRDAVHFSFRVM